MDKIDKGFLISTQKPSGRNLAQGKSIKQLSGIKNSVFARDKYTCQYCGFSSKKQMRWVAKDSNPFNMQEPNMMTVCLLCHDTLNCGVSDGKAKGSLIFLPQLTQIEINWILHVYFILNKNNSMPDFIEKVTSLINGLRENAKQVESMFGKGASNPVAMKNVMSMMSEKHRQNANRIFYGLRYFASINEYSSEYQSIASTINKDQFNTATLEALFTTYCK